ncbi:HYR-like domain-containing protein, partial [Paucihalobacter ruber]
WTATDECGNETSHSQTITVQDTTAPAFVEALPADATVECDAVPTADTLTATDNCGDATVTFNETITEGACAGEFTVVRTWTATDECGNETSHSQTITVQDNTAPTFVEALPADATVECDAVPTAETLTATDNCGDATVTFNETITEGACAGEFTVVRTWTATDECGNETSHSQTITVQDNTAPTIDNSNLENINIECGITPEGTLEAWLLNNAGATATDTCGNVTWSNDFGANTELDCANGAITVTFTATDECGNSATTTATYAIIDTVAPVLTVPSDVTIECTDDSSPTNTGTATATDDCAMPNVSFVDTEVAACGNTKTITRTWTATDACGNTASADQIITVIDSIAPTFVEALPADATVECDAVPTADTLTATDNCGDATVTFNETITEGACAGEFTVVRTWTATDECGNETSHSQTITVQDTTAPAFVEALPADATVE